MPSSALITLTVSGSARHPPTNSPMASCSSGFGILAAASVILRMTCHVLPHRLRIANIRGSRGVVAYHCTRVAAPAIQRLLVRLRRYLQRPGACDCRKRPDTRSASDMTAFALAGDNLMFAPVASASPQKHIAQVRIEFSAGGTKRAETAQRGLKPKTRVPCPAVKIFLRIEGCSCDLAVESPMPSTMARAASVATIAVSVAGLYVTSTGKRSAYSAPLCDPENRLQLRLGAMAP